MEAERIRQALAATITSFDASLRHDMPATTYRDFQVWALRCGEKDNWWQLLGIPQAARLTAHLLSDMVDDGQQWEQLLGYAAVMNRYLIYAEATDSFAAFLQTAPIAHPLRPFQIHTVSRLNDTMIARLGGDTTSTGDLLGMAKSAVGKLSCFGSGSTRDQQLAFARRFSAEWNVADFSSIEYGGWSLLVAHVEACTQVAQAQDGKLLNDLLREGLSWRYQAVNRLLYSLDLSLPELVEIGAYSAPVIPYLTYFIALLNEVFAPNQRLETILEDERLEKALYKAALLVRLANDTGTELLTDASSHAPLIERLSLAPQASINEALLALGGDDPMLARFGTNLARGAYNICLYDAGACRNTAASRARLAQNLRFLAGVYQQQRLELLAQLDAITALMNSDLTSKLIWRFVRFHEKRCSTLHHAPAGEYATTPNA